MSRADRQAQPEAKPCRIDTRFTGAERALVERAAMVAGLPLSAFVRGAAVDEARRRLGYSTAPLVAAVALPSQLSPATRAALDAVRVEVKRVGVNLNQLVRASHHGEVDLGVLSTVVEELAEGYVKLVGLLGGKAS